jgi:hypothetical protein
MSFEEDPEVVADLKLRAYTQRDRSRSGEPDYDWKPPPVATQWKCRTPPCKAFVDVTTETLERWQLFNEQLKRNGDKSIGSHEVLWCESCLAEHRRIQPDRLRKRVDRMASVIRQIKDGDKTIRYRTNDGEVTCDQRAALAQLRVWGHPDVDGLIAKLAEVSKGSATKRTRRGDM